MKRVNGLGWLPDVPKPKDYHPTTAEITEVLGDPDKTTPMLREGLKFLASGGTPPTLPSKVDLTPDFSSIERQGTINACTAFTAISLIEYFERRATGKHIDASPLFLYKAARNLLQLSGDSGASLRAAMQAMVFFGVPPEKHWRYDEDKVDVEPPAFLYAFAQNYKALRYFRLDPFALPASEVLFSVKLFLSQRIPSMFGLPIFEEYTRPRVHPTFGALVDLPAPGSLYSGGHANVVAGYDDSVQVDGASPGALRVRNSWGDEWGDGGYAWLPYDYVLKGMTADWWTVTSFDWTDAALFS